MPKITEIGLFRLLNYLLKYIHRIGIARPRPVNQFDGITPAAARFHSMDGVLGDFQLGRELTLIEPRRDAKFEKQGGQTTIG